MGRQLGARQMAMVVGLVLAGCSDDGPPPIDDPAAYVALMPQLECDFLVRCGVLATPEHCAPYQSTYPGNIELAHYDARYLSALERGTMAYSPDDAGRCAAWLRDRSCAFMAQRPRECARAFRPKAQIGDAVHWRFECETGVPPYTGCDEDRECCELECAEISGGIPIGEDCWPDRVGRGHCLRGKVCTDDFRCVAGPGPGGECQSDNDCPVDYLCHERRCRSFDRVGDQCIALPSDYAGQCVDIGSTCHADGVCRRRAFDGEPCNAEKYDSCAEGLACDGATSRCVGFGGAGAECGRTLCGSGLYCATSTNDCQPLRADGDACTDDRQCTSRFCTSATQTCGPRPVCP